MRERAYGRYCAMAWNKMTNYKKTKDWKAVNQSVGDGFNTSLDEMEEETRKKCDAMLLAAQKEAGDVRQQALRAAQATREEGKREAETLVAAAKEQAESIQAKAQNERRAVLTQTEREAYEILERAQKEAAAVRNRAAQAARAICQSTMKEARGIYLELQDEMNHMIDGINQAQNSFMKSYKEVHEILDTIPGKLIQLDGEDEELEDVPEVPADQSLLKHMEEILGEEPLSFGSGISEKAV